jgi:hypothetical protein
VRRGERVEREAHGGRVGGRDEDGEQMGCN